VCPLNGKARLGDFLEGPAGNVECGQFFASFSALLPLLSFAVHVVNLAFLLLLILFGFSASVWTAKMDSNVPNSNHPSIGGEQLAACFAWMKQN
jgi:hypothetical protein